VWNAIMNWNDLGAQAAPDEDEAADAQSGQGS
jgi:hypothetical protein